MKVSPRARRLSVEQLIWLGLGMAALAAVFIGVPSSSATALQTPRFWPAAAAGVMIAAGLLIALSALRDRGRLPSATAESAATSLGPTQQAEEPEPDVLRKHNHLILIAIIAAYVAALPYLGYVVATAMMAWGLAWATGVRKVLTATLASLTYVALTTVIFGVLMNVALPRGRGPFVDINSFFF